MRTIIKETTVYTFDELTPEAQEKAINHLRDINVDYEWWDHLYEDAATVGLRITGFDLDRNRHATGGWMWSALETAHKIIEEHGEDCETYQTAIQYLDDRKKPLSGNILMASISVQLPKIMNTTLTLTVTTLTASFLRSILEDYSIMLQNEYEYLTSEEAIKETIQANEYEFTAEGDLY